MKKLFFDAGPIISLTMNNLLWTLKPLKKQFNGQFCITKSVQRELTVNPLHTKKFKFEALQVMELIKSGVLTVVENKDIEQLGEELLESANKCFKVRGHHIKIVQPGEMEILAALVLSDYNIMVVDERTTRDLIENPNHIMKRFERKMHSRVEVDKQSLAILRKRFTGIKCIRSFELVTIAYELGLLNKFLPDLPNAKEVLLDSLLWGVKIDGCSVSKSEIEEVKHIEKKA